MMRIALATAFVAVTVSLVWLAGCSGGGGSWSPAASRIDPNGQLPAIIALCQQDLATRLGLSEMPKVVELTEVQWPDTSLGYPQPGHAYAMVITPGYRVVLEAQGQQYEYHTNKSSAFAVSSPAAQ